MVARHGSGVVWCGVVWCSVVVWCGARAGVVTLTRPSLSSPSKHHDSTSLPMAPRLVPRLLP